MSIQKPIYIKTTGGAKKFRAVDKIESTTLSALATTAQETPDTTVTVEAGTYYLESTQIDFSQLVVDFGASGSHELAVITSGSYAKILLTADIAGSINARQGTENVVEGSAVAPAIPGSEIPLAVISVQSNGAGAGQINVIAQTSITDIRSHLAPFNAAPQSALIDNLRVVPKLDGSFNLTTNLTVQDGHFWGKSDELFRFTSTDIGFGSGGSHEASAFSNPNYFNKIFLYVDSLGNIISQEGTANSTLGTVTEPGIDTYAESTGRSQMPLAVISVQNDGVTGVGGSINVISDSDIESIRPLFQHTGDISSVTQTEFTASGTVAQYEVAGLNTNGTVSTTKAVTSDLRPALAIAVLTANDGATVKFVTFGEVENSGWSFTNIGGKVYLSATTLGGLTETEPELSTTPSIENYIQPVGRILSATKILFNFYDETITNTL